MNKIAAFLLTTLFAWSVFAKGNIEVHATYVRDNTNFIYMDSETHRLKIKKAELTEEGVKQILANKESKLTLFIPEKSIVKKDPLKKKDEDK